MKRSLTLNVNPHKDGGVSLTVVHAELESDETTSDSHSTRVTEKLPGEKAVVQAAALAIEDYFTRVHADGQKEIDESPVGRAIRKASKKGDEAEA